DRNVTGVQTCALPIYASAQGLDTRDKIEDLERKADALRRELYAGLTPIQRVQLARHPQRPYALDYIERIFTQWTELHGDRHFAETGRASGREKWERRW